MARPRDYKNDMEIHMEPGSLHEPVGNIPEYPSELESALAQVARKDETPLKGTNHDIASRRIERNGERRYLGVSADWKRDYAQ